MQRRCDRWRSDRQRACGLARHTRGIPRVDPLTGRDDAGRGLAGDDAAKAIALDDRERHRAGYEHIFPRAFSVRCFRIALALF